ncbi:hypothetical protein SLA2020_167890 [Shorea laevis]
MLLWSLENCEKARSPTEGRDGSGEETRRNSLLSMLEQNPQIGQTKLGELAKSFLLEPFLLIIGFATQNAVIQLLLQCDGLQWFDNIASRALSEFRFENEKHVDHVFGDESLEETLQVISKSQIGAIAVIDRATRRLSGCFRRNDVHLLMEDDLYRNRKNITMETFIQMEIVYLDFYPSTEGEDIGVLCLRNCYGTGMDSPVTNKRSDKRRQAMKNMVTNKSKYSFLIDNSCHLLGILTLRDIIVQFAPPCIDSSIHGVDFFESALEEVGCRVKNGNVVSYH